jgi:hypothetical protein
VGLVEQQNDVPLRVAVEGEGDRCRHGDFHPELLQELAAERLVRAFAILDRAPGELPESAEV